MSERFVIDPSILMQAYIKDTHTEHVKALLSLLKTDDVPELHLPEMGLAEVANVLWKHQALFDEISVEYGLKVLQNIRDMPLILHPIEQYLDQAYVIGGNHRLAVYDSLYIALAKHLEIPLITADQKQGQIAERVQVSLKSITDF